MTASRSRTLRGEEDAYDQRHPTPADLGVLIEVGDSTFLADRRYKGELYAREKVPEFWLINVGERAVEDYTRPRSGKYQKMGDFSTITGTAPEHFPGKTG